MWQGQVVDASKPLPFEPNTFDAVFCNDSMCHIPGPAPLAPPPSPHPLSPHVALVSRTHQPCRRCC